MARHARLGELLIGTAGVALMRQIVTADDAAVAKRIAEIRRVIDSWEQPPYSLGSDTEELDRATGYAAWSQSYDDETNPLIDCEQPLVWELLDHIPPGRAVDAACGTGRHATRLAALGHEVVGVDATPEMVAIARSKVPSGSFVLGRLEALPLPDASADLVVCALALTHLPDLAPALLEFGRVVKPGGRVVLSDIHPASVMIIGQAFFPHADGRLAWVRNHVHWPSAYLAAFRSGGLRVRSCAEPQTEFEHLPRMPNRVLPEATRAAFLGLPFALIWDLER